MLQQPSKHLQFESADLLDKAAAFAGQPRERVIAIMDAMSGSAAGGGGCEQGLVSRLVDVVLDAVRCGDLQLPTEQHPEEKALAVCVIALGIGLLMEATAVGGGTNGNDHPAARAAMDEFLDAQGWRPLSTEWDYRKTRERVASELLATQRRRAAVV